MDPHFTFYLYRLTVHAVGNPGMLPVYQANRQPGEVIADLIRSQPTASIRGTAQWLIGNVTTLDDGALYFRFGRRGKKGLPTVDEDGHFSDETHEWAPNTHALFIPDIQVCSIAQKAELAQKVSGLGRLLATVLSRSKKAHEDGIALEAAPLKNPGEFLRKLESARSISRFWVKTLRPNPFTGDFFKATGDAVVRVGAREATSDFRGTMSYTPEMTDMAVGAAARGADAGATIRDAQATASKRVSMGDDTVSIQQAFSNVAEHGQQLVGSARTLFKSIASKASGALGGTKGGERGGGHGR